MPHHPEHLDLGHNTLASGTRYSFCALFHSAPCWIDQLMPLQERLVLDTHQGMRRMTGGIVKELRGSCRHL